MGNYYTNQNQETIDELLDALIPLAAWAELERREHNANDEENEAAYMGELADNANAAIKKATANA